MASQESNEIAAIVDQFPEWVRIRMRDCLMKVAEVYATMVPTKSVARMRAEYLAFDRTRAAPLEAANQADAPAAEVIDLDSRRTRAG